MIARWSLTVAISGAAFALSWWICQNRLGLDEAVSLAVAGAVLAVVIAIAGWWAVRERDGDGGRAAVNRRLVQKARAGRDINMAGRDQTIVNYRRRDE